ncbi:uncharacterized protein LOC113873504 [Abrus precatorius]|uniref:Uncharacterized protein LOC113873504 n=1 Tax=Abrus precatorius TaxID=3816 RepID=A0A8B8MHT2_ABRPR|nr:uncharacterized protein LOC113873504 [Abrus precatorius]
MASRKSFLSKPSHIFPETTETHLSPTQEGLFEFDEAELWNSSTTLTESKNALPSGSRSVLKRASRKVDNGGGRVMAPASLPVNIPDWSKILKDDYKKHPKCESDEEYFDDEENHREHRGGIRVPPHEYLARTRGASFSVHEGIGRTLKGRDLRSVRNAIWKKVGFED